MSDSTPLTDAIAEIRAAIADERIDRTDRNAVVEQFMNQHYDHATFDITSNGIHIKWENPNDTVPIDGEALPADEPFLDVFFKYWHENETEDPNEPFLNRHGYVTLRVTDTDGEWRVIEGLEPTASDELYAELQGAVAPHKCN